MEEEKQSRVCCPNHEVALEGVPTPPPRKGVGVCPISKCRFDYEADSDPNKVEVDKFGNVKQVKWRLEGND